MRSKLFHSAKAIKSFLGKPFLGVSAGMSMIEIMIVVSLIGILMSFIVRNVMGAAQNAKIDQTKIAFNVLVQDLQRYKLDNNKYPTSEQGLAALLASPGGDVKNWRGPYTEDNKVQDPWGEKFTYESDGRNFKIISGGPDQVVGNEDDITYPETKKDEGGTP